MAARHCLLRCQLYSLHVAATPGTQPRLLGAAQGGYTGNTWCKMAPSMLPYEDGQVAFLTFSSMRPIGLRPNSWNQIFFAAFDPARAAAGLDGSFSAVHLPWQSLTNGNHIAQWATDIVHEPCGPMGECPEEFECQKGECVPIID